MTQSTEAGGGQPIAEGKRFWGTLEGLKSLSPGLLARDNASESRLCHLRTEYSTRRHGGQARTSKHMRSTRLRRLAVLTGKVVLPTMLAAASGFTAIAEAASFTWDPSKSVRRSRNKDQPLRPTLLKRPRTWPESLSRTAPPSNKFCKLLDFD